MYHLPIKRGAGWAWGARSRRRAFIRGVGFPSSLGTDGWTFDKRHVAGHAGVDVENTPGMQQAPQEHVEPEGSDSARLEA